MNLKWKHEPKFRWYKNSFSKAELWDCRVLGPNDDPQSWGRYVGSVRYHEGDDRWRAYRMWYGSKNPNKYLLSAETLEEAQRAFEVAVRIE